MGNARYQKISIYLITFLLIGTGFLTIASGDESNKAVLNSVNTLYVGGTGPGNYSSIQSAIDDSSDGDTVFVYAGVYDENIRISTQIQLIGIEKEKTIISASNSSEFLILDSVDFAFIENLSFLCMDDEQFDVIKMVKCNNCTISNIDLISETLQRSAIKVNGFFNTVEKITTRGRYFFAGVELFHGGSNTIKNNSFESCSEGILIHRSHNNLVSSNEMTNTTNGIYIEEGNNNFITRNILKSNIRGIFSSYSPGNLIEKNDFLDNGEHVRFLKLLKIGFLLPNTWRNNYWDDYKGFFIKPILGVLYIPNRNLFGWFFPWFEFDKCPSTEPLNIS